MLSLEEIEQVFRGEFNICRLQLALIENGAYGDKAGNEKRREAFQWGLDRLKEEMEKQGA